MPRKKNLEQKMFADHYAALSNMLSEN